MKPRLSFVAFLLSFVILSLGTSPKFLCGPTNVYGQTQEAGKPTTTVSGTCFGPIHYQVTIGAVLDSAQQEQMLSAVQQRLDEINAKMSTYRDDSDVSRFNQSATTDWFEVDTETAEVISQALQISKNTDGAFDITVGPLVGLWKFGAGSDDETNFKIPSDEEIALTLERIGYQKLTARLAPPAIKKSIPELQIDLSAIAKGYGVDEVARVVEEAGYSSYFVEVGEEVRAAGRHPADRPWMCGIEKPLENVRAIDLRVPVINSAIATSGDYRQFRIVDGRRLTHTIDPRTGQPTDHAVALASIQADNCTTADAYATAMMVLGKDKAIELADQEGLGLHLVIRNQDGQLTTVRNQLYPENVPLEGAASASWIVPVGVSLLVFGVAIVSMSVGVIFKRQPIKGSCGGLANMPGKEASPCELCSNPSKECRELGRGAKKAMEEQQAESGNRSGDS